MFDVGFVVKVRLSKIINEDGFLESQLDKITEAAALIVEAEYKRESPVDKGDYRQSIWTRKDGELERAVRPTIFSLNGSPYPVLLYEGTGRQKGAPDAGYTPGRVRSGDVASGTGGIRPNKVADRARNKAEPKVYKFFSTQIEKVAQDSVTFFIN